MGIYELYAAAIVGGLTFVGGVIGAIVGVFIYKKWRGEK